MALKLYKNVAKGSKLKVRKFSEPILTFVQVTWKNWWEALFGPNPILRKIKIDFTKQMLVFFKQDRWKYLI